MKSYRTEEKNGDISVTDPRVTEQIQHEDIIPTLQKVSGTSIP
jgi:hypothetical protein